MSTAVAEKKTISYVIELEPQIYEQAENILNQIGMSLSDAINLFNKQVILQNGFPIDLKLPARRPICIEDLTKEEFDALIHEAFDDIDSGRTFSSDEMKERIAERYGVKF